VCLVVLGRHVPQLEFLDVMLGSSSPLPLEAKIYQRLLADDLYEAADEAEEHGREEGLETLYDQVLLSVLSLALSDRYRRAITHERFLSVAQNVREIAEESAELELVAEAAKAEEEGQVEGDSGSERRVLVLGGRHAADDAAAQMLAELLRRSDVSARFLGYETMIGRQLARLDLTGVEGIVLVYVAPSSLQHAHRAVFRLRRRIGRATPILVAIPQARREILADPDISIDGADGIARSLAAAVRLVAEMRPQEQEAPAPAPEPPSGSYQAAPATG
jgi:hypothetical protein